jgi:Domain of unknown function (DUF5011)
MKRQIINYIAVAIIGALCFACEPDLETKGISRITHFPDITMVGDPIYVIELGQAYSEPGISAKEGENPIDVITQISGDYFEGSVTAINTANPDRYNIAYSAINSDGFPGSTARTVYVAGKGDLVTDISGLYTSTVVRNGVSAAKYTDMKYVIMKKTGASTYSLSDIICGYYDVGRAIGPDYAGTGSTITVNNLGANDFTFGPSIGIGVFGGVADIKQMTVDPLAKQIHLVIDWDAGPYTFVITLTKAEF